MSDEEVAKLVARHQGESILSDQSIWTIVMTKAKQISNQINRETIHSLEAQESDAIITNKAVKIYEVDEPEILLLDDGIQVKGQREKRRKTDRQSDSDVLPTKEKRKTSRVNTDVVVLETSTGEFEHIMAPLDTDDELGVSLSDVIKPRVIDLYGPQKCIEYGGNNRRCSVNSSSIREHFSDWDSDYPRLVSFV